VELLMLECADAGFGLTQLEHFVTLILIPSSLRSEMESIIKRGPSGEGIISHLNQSQSETSISELQDREESKMKLFLLTLTLTLLVAIALAQQVRNEIPASNSITGLPRVILELAFPI
jgi:hypothetical protein